MLLVQTPRAHSVIKNIGTSADDLLDAAIYTTSTGTVPDPNPKFKISDGCGPIAPSLPPPGTIYHRTDEDRLYVVDQDGNHVPVESISRMPGEDDESFRNRLMMAAKVGMAKQEIEFPDFMSELDKA